LARQMAAAKPPSPAPTTTIFFGSFTRPPGFACFFKKKRSAGEFRIPDGGFRKEKILGNRLQTLLETGASSR
jgi:hypothetical protein